MMRVSGDSILVAAGIAAIGAFLFLPYAEMPAPATVTVKLEEHDPSWAASRDAAASLADVLTLHAACLEAELQGNTEAAACQDLARLIHGLLPEEASAEVPSAAAWDNPAVAVAVPKVSP